MIVYLFWLVMVILWNYGVPSATPIEDVVMAIFIGFISYKLKKILPDPAILRRNKYFGNKK
tara:strand:+ start:399 stop:581 length:183 start_codon:yes stop_codon:yes gene_type:complete